jgi:hypothetical protein
MAANIFTGVTNSNWGTATNWSLAAVPTATDTNIATFNAASPNCTVNVTAVCNNIDFTGYTNTITMTNGITVSGNVTFDSTMTSRVAGSGSLSINGTSAIVTNGATWNNALLFPGSGTKTITGTLTVTGLFTSVASNQTVNGGALILNGGMTITGNMSGGTTSVTLGGGTWSGTAFLGNPLTFAGNSTISGAVAYGGSTLTYTSGIITTTGSTVSISSATLNVSAITFNNITVPAGSTGITLSAALNLSGTLTVTPNTSFTGAFNITTVGIIATGQISGTASIILSGGGTWSGAGAVTTNLTFAGNTTISATVSYGTGVLTYSSGTITTTSSTLSLVASCTLNVASITWNNVILNAATQTYTLTSDLNISATFSLLAAANIVNGAFNINVSGSFNSSFALSGTATIIMNGTGTWSGVGAVRNNLTINTAGTITISGTINYNTGTLTYTTGTVTTTGSTLTIAASTTLNCAGITWNNITFNNASQTCTLSSNLNLSGTLTFANVTMTTTINGAFSINCSGSVTHANGNTVTGTCLGLNLTGTGTYINNGTSYQFFPLTINTAGTITFSANININATTFTYTAGTVIWTGSTLNTLGAGTVLTLGTQVINNLVMGGLATYTVTLSADLNVAGNASMGTLGPLTVNGFTLKIGGNLTISNNVTISGTTTFLLNGTGTWSCNSIGIIQNNLTINTAGAITISGVVYYNTGTLTYTAGTVVAKGSTLNLGTTTLINCHKINFDTVTITSGNTVTMNEFFSGSPNQPVKVQATLAATNYIITFQNGFEKIAKYVKVSNLTLTNTAVSRGSLLILNNKGKYFTGSSNIGNIRYINQSPNGISKGNPTVPNPMTTPIGGYVSDPIFN